MVMPSRRWFPRSLPARAVWFQNFRVNFSDVATSLGFTAADVTSVGNDNQIIQFLAQTIVQLDSYEDSIKKYLEIITESEIGKPVPVFPDDPGFTLPVEVPTGIFERLVDLVERIKVAPNYTDSIGALLGILPTASDSVTPDNVKPSIKAFASSGDYEFSIVVSDREKATQWNVEILREGQTKWQTVKTATGKSVDVEVPPTVEGKPERIQVRVQLIKNNEDYGQPSDPTFVTLNP
jgi:hypothetical protein